jgi:hypothetical protein
MRLLVGTSTNADARIAAGEAIAASRTRALAPVFALVFATDDYDATALASAMTAELGAVPWAGSTAAGVIADGKLYERGIAVGLVSGDDVRVGFGVGGPVSTDSAEAGRTAAADALRRLGGAPSGNRTVIVIADALGGRAEEIVEGIVRETGAGVVCVGGVVGDDLRQTTVTQFAQGQAFTDRVIVIAMESAARVAAGVHHGWRPHGPPAMVTTAHGSLVEQLEYESAVAVYTETIVSAGDAAATNGDFASFGANHPFGIAQSEDYVIRDAIAKCPNGSVRCIGCVPEGCMVRVMVSDPESLVEAARSAASTARNALDDAPSGALVFDCASRVPLLGDAFPSELAAVQATLGSSVPTLGCLTFGEVGALARSVPQFHNKAVVVLALPPGSEPSP